MPSSSYILGNQYLFTEGSGTSVNDTADSNDITLTGSPNWVTGRTGGYALEFTGASTQYGQAAVNWAVNASDPLVNSIYYWLVRIWFKTTTASGRALWGIRQYTHTENVCCYVGTDGKLKVLFASVAGDGVLVEPAKIVTDGEWHEVLIAHCSGLPDNMVSRAYLDADYIGGGSGYDVAHSNSAAPHRIGGGIVIPNTYSGAHATASDTAGWTGTLGSVEVFWWNTETCTDIEAHIEDEITWTPSMPANAMMFSCNT